MERRLAAKAAAAYVDVGYVTWRGYVHRGTAPKPDGKDEDFGRDYWLVSTLDQWKANRPGQGARRDLKNDGHAPTA